MDARDAARAHPDRGRRDAQGRAAEAKFYAAADALQLAEKRWEEARSAHLARLEKHDDEALSLPTSDT